MGERDFGRGTAGVKALKRKYAWLIPEKAGKPCGWTRARSEYGRMERMEDRELCGASVRVLAFSQSQMQAL